MTCNAAVRSNEWCIFFVPIIHRGLVAVNTFHFAGAVCVTVLRVLEHYRLQLTPHGRDLPGLRRTDEVALFTKRIIPRIQTTFTIQRMAVSAVFFTIVTFVNEFDVCLMGSAL